MPLALGSDGFTGAGLTLLQGREFDSGGLFWDVLQGSFSVQGGMCRVTEMVPNKSVAVVRDLEPRDYLRTKVAFRSLIDDKVGTIVRVQPDGTSYYLAYFSRPYVHLFRVDAGVAEWLALADVSAALTATAFMEIEISADAIKLFWNAVQILAFTDATYALGGAGIQVSEPNQWIDSFELLVDPVTTTVPPTTVPGPTTIPPTTIPPTVPPPPTTVLTPEPTFPPTTIAPTTAPPTTIPPTVPPTTVPGPTTIPPTTIPVTNGERIRTSFCYVEAEDRLLIDAWLVNDDEVTNTEALVLASCAFDLIDEFGTRLSFTGVASAHGAGFVRFVIPQARLYAEHLYLAEISLSVLGDPPAKGPAIFALPVT